MGLISVDTVSNKVAVDSRDAWMRGVVPMLRALCGQLFPVSEYMSAYFSYYFLTNAVV
jgi:hypothetical protein